MKPLSAEQRARYNARKNAREKERRATDPEYRARKNAREKERRATDPEYRARQKERRATAEQRARYYARENARRATDPEYRARKNARKYGLDPAAVERMWAAQNGKCLLCDIVMLVQGNSTNPVHIDHCHTTGRVRGLLCRRCNTQAGIIEKRGPEWLARVLDHCRMTWGLT